MPGVEGAAGDGEEEGEADAAEEDAFGRDVVDDEEEAAAAELELPALAAAEAAAAAEAERRLPADDCARARMLADDDDAGAAEDADVEAGRVFAANKAASAASRFLK
jgi:hypothetical protein